MCHNLIQKSFFGVKIERRKIERTIRRLEKLQRSSSAHVGDAELAEQLNKLKEDLEYVRVSLTNFYTRFSAFHLRFCIILLVGFSLIIRMTTIVEYVCY